MFNQERHLNNYNQSCIEQDIQDRYDAYSSEPPSPAPIVMKCDTGLRERWMQAQDIWFPQFGLVKLFDPIDWGCLESVTFESELGIVEVSEGQVKLWRNCFR